MVQEINRWLSGGRDYATGVALYEQYGTSSVLKRLFSSGPSSFNRDKLLEALQKLVATAPVQDTSAPHIQPAATKPRKKAPAYSAKPEENIPASPELVEQVMAQLRPLFDERMLTHAKLDSPRLNDQERLKMALRIHELSAQIKKLLQVRAHVLEHGRLPEEKQQAKVDETDKASLIQYRNNLRSTRSKLKKQPEKEAELETINTEIERLTTLIKDL